jgi:hypothetical protein
MDCWKIDRMGRLLSGGFMKNVSFLTSLLAWMMLMSLVSFRVIAGGDDEIQVYTDQINGKGNYGWEMHQNWVPIGIKDPEYQGDSAPQGQIRHTSEFSYGLTDNLELGAYVPLLYKNGTLTFEGGRGRIKYLDHYNENVFYGVNTEYGYATTRSDEYHWGTELRPILGYRDDDWLFAINPTVEWATAGKEAWKLNFTPQMKVSRTVGNGIMLGIEHYADFGTLSNTSMDQQTHTTYLALDTIKFNTNFNLAVGHGWSSATNDLVVKFIVGLPIGGWTEKLIGL